MLQTAQTNGGGAGASPEVIAITCHASLTAAPRRRFISPFDISERCASFMFLDKVQTFRLHTICPHKY